MSYELYETLDDGSVIFCVFDDVNLWYNLFYVNNHIIGINIDKFTFLQLKNKEIPYYDVFENATLYLIHKNGDIIIKTSNDVDKSLFPERKYNA